MRWTASLLLLAVAAVWATSLGAGFVFWVDRGTMGADDAVPCGDDLLAFLAAVQSGERPWLAPTLGDRAIERFRQAVESRPESVEVRPGLEGHAFQRALEERDYTVTYATGRILSITDGIYFAKSERRIHPFEQQRGIENGAIAVVGSDPDLGHLGVTRGDWQGLPADRLIAFTDLDHPEHGRLLGRFADVLTFWIEEARSA